jgi:hypothetical protein
MFGNLRLRNIFNPDLSMNSTYADSPAMGNNYTLPDFGGNQPINVPQPQQMQSPDDYDAGARMKQLYTPETSASDRLNSMIDNMPHYNEHQGKLRSIAAAIIAATQGAKAGSNALMAPYHHQMDEWNTKIKPVENAATLEKNTNSINRQMANATINSELTDRRDTARQKTNDANTKIREDRANVYRFKVEHPDKKFNFTGPTVTMTDPRTGEITNTGIATGSLSDGDKLDLQHKNRIGEIDETGKQARDTEATRQTGRIAVVDEQGKQTRETNAEKPLTNKGETPSQTKTRQYNAAKEFAAKNPKLAQFIKFGKSNEFTITAPVVKTNDYKDFFRGVGPTDEEHNAITNAIYGGALQVPQPGRIPDAPTNTGTPVSQPSTKAPIPGLPPEGKIKVSNDGGKTKHWLPFKQYEEAKKQGYTQVQ